MRVAGGCSEPIQVRNGLRQGCVMAPVLFNLYFAVVLERPTHLGDSAGTTTSRLPSPTQTNQEGELSSGEETTPTDANTISSLLKAARQSSTRADMNIGDRDVDHGKEATEDAAAKSTDNGDYNDTGDGDDFKLTLSP